MERGGGGEEEKNEEDAGIHPKLKTRSFGTKKERREKGKKEGGGREKDLTVLAQRATGRVVASTPFLSIAFLWSQDDSSSPLIPGFANPREWDVQKKS